MTTFTTGSTDDTDDAIQGGLRAMMAKHMSLPLLGIVFLSGLVLWLTLSYRLIDPGGVDTIGYVQAAHQLARGEGLAYDDPNNQIDRRYYTLQSFRVFRPGDANRYYGNIPGTAILAAILERLSGDPGAVYILMPLLAVVLIGSTYLLGSRLFNGPVGLWAGLALVAVPIFLQFSTEILSEVPSAAFITAGFVISVIALRRASDDFWTVFLSVAGGLAIGIAFFIRFSNVSVLPALLALVWTQGGRSALKRRRAVWLVGSALLALAALFVFNTTYYGGPFTTGYSPLHTWYEEPAFSVAYAFGGSFANGYSVPALATRLIVDYGWLLLFVIVALIVRPRMMSGWLFVLGILLLTPYAFYAFATEGINARFVIPAYPAICLLIGRGIVALGARLPSTIWRWAFSFVLIIGMFYNLPANLTSLESRNQSAQASIARVQKWVMATEPNAVLMSYIFNDAIAVYGHRSVLNYRHMPPYDPVVGTYQYDRFEELFVDEINRLLSQSQPVYYILDTTPSLFDSFEILSQYFIVERVIQAEPIFRVRLRES